MTILHGDNQFRSRQKLGNLIDEWRTKGADLSRLDAKRMTRSELENTLAQTSLFGTEKLIVIEGLFSLPRSKNKDELVELALKSELPLIIWEPKSITPAQLKKLSGQNIENFKLSSSLFKWLESLRGDRQNQSQSHQLFQDAIDKEGEWICMSMLTRQIRLLIQAKDGGQIKAPPFVISKLKNQTQTFSLAKLLDFHRNLLTIDLNQKTGVSSNSLTQELDILLLTS